MPIKVTGGSGSSDAQGTDSKPAGVNAHAEGKSALASGAQSHAEGRDATVSGQDAHGEGWSASATGDQSHAEGYNPTASNTAAHSEGANTVASGLYSHAEGNATTASGSESHSEGGSTTASGANSHAEGNTTTASGSNSHAGGQRALASRTGQWSRSAQMFAATGDAQTSVLVLMKSTTDATPAALTASGVAVALTGVNTNVLTIPVSKAHRFRVEAVARNTAADEFAGWTITGTIVRHSSGNARFIATPVTATEADAAAAAWTLVASVNTGDATNNYLALTATGEAAKTIRWVAALYTTEVG